MVDSRGPHPGPDATDQALIEAFRGVAREDLAPAGKAWLAYADAEVEYAPGRWLLRPRDVAKLLQALKPRSGETALAISAPYAAAVLDLMGLAVTRIDAQARSVLGSLGTWWFAKGPSPRFPRLGRLRWRGAGGWAS